MTTSHTHARAHAATAPPRLLRALVVVLSLALAWVVPRATRAEDEVRAAVSYFHEPAANTPVVVIHPQVRYSQDFGRHFGLEVGYDADIVSGATPQIFGIDVVTAATDFADRRHSGTLGFRLLTELVTLRLAGGFAGESDYLSGTVSAGATADLFDRNTQISIDYTHNFDRVCDAANVSGEDLLDLRALDNSDDCFTGADRVAIRKLAIDTIQTALTQVVTPWLVLQLGGTGQILQGFQANPYRQVLLGRRPVQEHLPDVRNRIAGFARAKFALRAIRGSIDLAVRGYADSWAIEAFTSEIGWNQYLARPLILRLRARWHYQDSALFYRDGNEYVSSGAIGSYWTGDRELSALMNTMAGVKITYLWRAKDKPILKFIDSLVLSAKADMLFYRSLTDHPRFSPNYERTQGLLDAWVIQAQFGFDF